MRLSVRSTQNQGIPTASMADIAFLLIIFFMVTINFEVDKTQVLLPKTALRLEIPKKSAYISIIESGQIRVSSGEEISVPVPGPENVLQLRRQGDRRTQTGQSPDDLPALRAGDRRHHGFRRLEP